MTKLNSLSRKLTRIGGITLSIVAFFPQDKMILNTKYFQDTKTKQIYLDFPSFLRFELPYTPNGNGKRSVNLTYMGKVQMIATMKRMISHLASKEVFVKDPELGLTITRSLNEKGRSRWIVYENINQTPVAISPVVIKEDLSSYEGVCIMLNAPENRAEMTIAEFIALKTFLEDVDIWSLSQNLFNTALLLESSESFDREPNTPVNLLEQLQDNLAPRKVDRNVNQKEFSSNDEDR